MSKLKITFYMASAIEHNEKLKDGKKEDWKAVVKKELNNPVIGIYDPVEREAQKTGKQSGETVAYIQGLKQGGHWERFHQEMGKIWWGGIGASEHRPELMMALRTRFLIDGNEMRDLDFWGDYEAVLRSNFIIAYMEKNVKTVGTIAEIHTCYLFQIPVFLVFPDQTRTEANSTLIDMVIKSGGQIFYSIPEVIKHIKETYKV